MNKLTLIAIIFLITIHLNAGLDFNVSFDNLTFVLKDLEPIEEDTWFDSDKPEKCYFRSIEHYWNVGEQWGPSSQCWIARCTKPGQVIILSCGEVEAVADGYTNKYCHKIGMDFSRPFPGCCMRFMCRSFNSSTPYIYSPLVPGGGRERPYYKRWIF